MVKKIHKADAQPAAQDSGAGSLFDSQLAQTVKDSAQQIWLAGLGAFAKAQGGGGKVFDALMKEGVSLQRKTQAVAEEKIGDVAGKMTAMAGEVGHRANAQWDKLESIFEERTARALGKLGVPSAKELAALSDRVDALAAAVAKLGGDVAPPAAPARKAARKSTKATAAPQPASANPASAAEAIVKKVPKFRPGKALEAAAAAPAAVPRKAAARKRKPAAA